MSQTAGFSTTSMKRSASHWKLLTVWVWCGSHILYNFIWDEFADWYVELTKEVLIAITKKRIITFFLLHTLDQILRLLHPIMPFVTEEIFGQISEGSIVTAEYPTVSPALEDPSGSYRCGKPQRLDSCHSECACGSKRCSSKPITILVKTSDSDLSLL